MEFHRLARLHGRYCNRMKTVGKVEGLSYNLHRRRNCRHIIVRVNHDGQVNVSAPPRVSKTAIEQVIIENQSKLRATIENQKAKAHSYSTGDVFLLRGEQYLLELKEGEEQTFDIVDQRFIITYTDQEPAPAKVCALVKELYRYSAKQRLSLLVTYWCNELALPIPPFSVRDSKSRWGSCSAKGKLNFSLRCAVLPDEDLSYLVLHELAHLVHFNHSAAFKQLLSKHMVSWRQRQQHMFSLQKQSQLCL